MSNKYYVVTYDEGTCNEPKIDSLFNNFRQAYCSLIEKYFINMHWDVYYSEFNPDDEFKWDLCICLAELDGSRIINHYPVRFYKLKKNYMQFDSNPIRLIDLMKILYHNNEVVIKYQNNDLSTKYDSLHKVPEELYNNEVIFISEGYSDDLCNNDKRMYTVTISDKEVKQ